jgi:hypothetical protein
VNTPTPPPTDGAPGLPFFSPADYFESPVRALLHPQVAEASPETKGTLFRALDAAITTSYFLRRLAFVTRDPLRPPDEV